MHREVNVPVGSGLKAGKQGETRWTRERWWLETRTLITVIVVSQAVEEDCWKGQDHQGAWKGKAGEAHLWVWNPWSSKLRSKKEEPGEAEERRGPGHCC